MDEKPKKKIRMDAKLISLEQNYERAYWAKALGVTPNRLRKLVEEVGRSAAKVRARVTKDRTREAEEVLPEEG